MERIRTLNPSENSSWVDLEGSMQEVRREGLSMYERCSFGPQLLLATYGLAAALTAACGNNTDRSDMNPDNRPAVGAPAATMSSQDQKPIDLTGCLQKSGRSYVITQIGTPSPAAAPPDKKDDSGRVEREQVTAPRHAYRLNAANRADLEKLIGKQVKVSGTVMEPSDLTGREDRRANDLRVGTSGAQDREHDRPEINTSDLASVEVASIQQVATGCGTRQ
jgi:hypothetical protein